MEEIFTQSTTNTAPLPFSEPDEQKDIQVDNAVRYINFQTSDYGDFGLWLSPHCLSDIFENRHMRRNYEKILEAAFRSRYYADKAGREAYFLYKHIQEEKQRKSSTAETQTSPVNTSDKEINTHIVWKIPPTTKVNATQTMKEKKTKKTAFSQTPTAVCEEKKTQTQRTTTEEKKIQTDTETKKKNEKHHKAANTQTNSIETKEKKIQTPNFSINEPKKLNEVYTILEEVSNALEAVPLSPLPTTPPRPPTTATTTTTTATTTECQPNPPPPTTIQEEGEQKKRRRPPPHIRRQQQRPQQQQPQHQRSQQQQRRRQQQWQYDEQQYPSWGFFNHPMADLVQLLLDHLYWPPAPAFRHPNGHRGQRRQQQQQRQHHQ